MAQTTVMDVYGKGEIVFSYVRGKDDFNYNDVGIEVYDIEQGN